MQPRSKNVSSLIFSAVAPVFWMYAAIICPSVTYPAVVWWPRVNLKTASRKLEHLQRLACLFITGTLRTTPTKALEILVLQMCYKQVYIVILSAAFYSVQYLSAHLCVTLQSKF